MSSNTIAADDCFWTATNLELASGVSSDTRGLSSQEATARLALYGPNEPVTSLRRSLLIKIGRRLIEPLTAILLLAALITGVMGDRESCVIIVVILTSSIALDLFQVQRAEAAVEALRKSVAVTAQVRRDGLYQTVLVRDIVPGDIIQLNAGGLVPADGVVLTSHDARTNEAILTGERPFDLFVRWKPLHEQPVGWNPDINDGVRLNIRPWLTAKPLTARGKNACILRATPKIKWDKDRGKEPQRPKADYPWFWSWDEATADFKGGATFDGNRWNDCHYTLAAKQAARERREQRG